MNTLNQSEFEALFNNAAIGIVSTDPEGNIRMINQFALSQFGYDRGALLGKDIKLLIPAQSSLMQDNYNGQRKRNNAQSPTMGIGVDLLGQRKDGTEFPIEISFSVYETEEGKFFIAFINDTSLRKRSEAKLKLLNAQLEDKVEARTHLLQEALGQATELSALKSRFVSIASHEFRTPLSTILSSAYLVTKYTLGTEQPQRNKHIQRIIKGVNTLTDILNDFLSVSRIEEGRIHIHLAPLDLGKWMQELIEELEPILKKGQQIAFVQGDELQTPLDASLLKHIMQNLLANAIKFSPENSTILLSTSRNANQLTITVQDKGIGISVDDQRHLFERFFRGSNAMHIPGTGLGLHIAGKYAELLKGSVVCNSVLGKGSIFTVTLPVTETIIL